MKLWGKLDENVELSQHFFVSFFYISSFHPTNLSLPSAQYVSACGSIVAFCAHDVISRERLPQMWDNTDTVRSAPIFRKRPNSAGLANAWYIFAPNIICFHLVYNEPTLLLASCSKNSILAIDEHYTENVRSAYHYYCHWTHTVKDSRGVRKCLLSDSCRECV